MAWEGGEGTINHKGGGSRAQNRTNGPPWAAATKHKHTSSFTSCQGAVHQLYPGHSQSVQEVQPVGPPTVGPRSWGSRTTFARHPYTNHLLPESTLAPIFFFFVPLKPPIPAEHWTVVGYGPRY